MEGPSIILNGFDTVTPSFTAPNTLMNTSMKFSLSVIDDKGISSIPSTVTIFVNPISNQSRSNDNTTMISNFPKEDKIIRE